MTNAPHEYERYCRSCRHSLRGITSRRCPECGRAFDPNDPKTMRIPDHPENWAALAPAFRVCTVIVGIVTSITFLATATFAIDPLLLLLGGCVTLPLLVLQFIVACSPIIPLSRVSRFAGVTLPILLVSIVLTYWPLRLTFIFHKSTLNQLAAQIQNGATVQTPNRVGMYRFHVIRTASNGNIGFQMTGDSGGGTYLVRAQPKASVVWYNTNWEIALGDGWFLVYED